MALLLKPIMKTYNMPKKTTNLKECEFKRFINAICKKLKMTKRNEMVELNDKILILKPRKLICGSMLR